MPAMTITEFLEARIAEDEEVASSASPGPWFRDSGWSISAPPPDGWDGPYVVVETPRARNDSEFVARHDPARVLAECAAKREVLRQYQTFSSAELSNWETRGFTGALGTLRFVLGTFAAVYTDHPDYQQEWAL